MDDDDDDLTDEEIAAENARAKFRRQHAPSGKTNYIFKSSVGEIRVTIDEPEKDGRHWMLFIGNKLIRRYRSHADAMREVIKKNTGHHLWDASAEPAPTDEEDW
jgi:hypothetical protein